MKKLSPSFIELTLDACLKAFWRKESLKRFLRQHHIKENALYRLNGETKREFLQWLFNKLTQRKDDNGHAIILKIARSLVEMEHFPDLENWEDSSEKILAARNAIARLKPEVDRLNKHFHDEKERERLIKQAREKQQETIAARQSLENLCGELTKLVSKQGTQRGGYEFEKWFYNLVIFFEIIARPPYWADGRQIDGSLTLDGTTFLVETKFTNEKTGSGDIDIFMSKIMSKADNTMGIVVSMGGYTGGAIKTASRPRTPMLLLDHSHIFNLILSGQMELPDVIKRIKRHASQTGESFLLVSKF